MMEGSPYKKVTMFVDNSGADIILGVLPFVRELLRRNTKVNACIFLLNIFSNVT